MEEKDVVKALAAMAQPNRLQVLDMEVYVEPFHVGYFQHWQLVDEASRQASAPWQQFSVR